MSMTTTIQCSCAHAQEFQLRPKFKLDGITTHRNMISFVFSVLILQNICMALVLSNSRAMCVCVCFGTISVDISASIKWIIFHLEVIIAILQKQNQMQAMKTKWKWYFHDYVFEIFNSFSLSFYISKFVHTTI